MRFSVQDITHVALFTALTVATAVFFRFTSGIIPFSLLPFMVMLAGGVLGSRLAATSMGLYVLMGLLGLPVFAQAPFGGLSYVLQPSFGFLLGFIVAAYVIGKIVELKSASLLTHAVANMLGLVIIYAVGLFYFWFLFNFYLGKPIDFPTVVKLGMLPFIIPDLVKGFVAAYLSFVLCKRLQFANIKLTTAK
ncbi:biotin transporter BioY [Zhaonella formicivorans]|uniref:biotin transporter BioY n=1 Tax=Zhaonella formicivorans TaxID=2528593 RepID=UPI001D0FEF1F|nr:biotin transporter BioY [Zhaonella formicivorans]